WRKTLHLPQARLVAYRWLVDQPAQLENQHLYRVRRSVGYGVHDVHLLSRQRGTHDVSAPLDPVHDLGPAIRGPQLQASPPGRRFL
ncbi:hypothetical protein H4R33_005622, partial [Dimargaris cristalligena]